MQITIKDMNKKTGGARKVFSINGHEITFSKTESNLEWIETFVNEVLTTLEGLDIDGFIRLQHKYNKSYLFKIAIIFPDSLEKFIRFTTEKMIVQERALTYDSIFSEICVGTPERNRYQYRFAVSIIDKVIRECEESLLDAIRKKDKHAVWMYTKILNLRLNGVALLQFCLQLGEAFNDYVRFCAEELKGEELTLGWVQLYRYTLFGDTKGSCTNYVFQFLNENNNIFKKVRTQIYLSKLQSIENKQNYKFNDDKWEVCIVEFEVVRVHNFDFTWLEGNLKKQVKKYMDKRLKERSEIPNKTLSRLNGIKSCLNILLPIYPLLSIMDINMAHIDFLIDVLQQQKDNKGNRKYRLSTIKGFYTELKLFYQFQYEKEDLLEEGIPNPFADFMFPNINAFVKKTKYIPEIVISKLEECLYELPLRVQCVWIIMMHSGMRIGEALELDEDSLYFDNEGNQWMLRYIPLKTRKIRKQKYHTIPAHEQLFKYFNIQKDNTAAVREETGTKRIFATFFNDRLTIHSRDQMADSINNLIKKYNITDGNGKLYRYSHHQCRKSLSVSLLTNGATLEEVSDFLGHLNLKTTEKSYKDLEMDKLADLELKYFNNVFDESANIEALSPYTQEEKEILIQELESGSRETPEGHGSCFKHISFGPCPKNKCSSCNFLITGPQYLPKWYQLYMEQEQVLCELVMKYKEQNIEGYENFINCQKIKHDLDIYKLKILEVEKTAEKVGISYERPSGLFI
ncbi:site-specific integrase [Paenibacillus sp. DMB5]|uniref:tyrosine-type recombinase/integrase n=1 Tax=Paenibacillus sp. DMB5 TaxID=1780103 RepID=UPI00076C63C9|nr:site-specific integrase [Paenibacillus sp. DMB5]KUP25794.1 hypothetical protein AWJ19_19410 [Paenibacillus sp. DMB5]